MKEDDFGHVLSHDSLEFPAHRPDGEASWSHLPDPSHISNDHASLDQMGQLIHWVCEASRRCQSGQYFIQAVQAVQGVCLATNVACPNQVEITTISSGWAVGRSNTCAIRVPHTSISRCHAIVNYYADQGFFITDLASRNGTWVNARRLPKMQRHPLRDGDLLRIGKVNVEFFVAGCEARASTRSYEETYS